MKNAIELAVSRGSTATTHPGAMRYLLAHLTPPAEGLTQKTPPRTIEELREYRAKRYEQRCDRIAFAIGVWRRDIADALAEELSGIGSNNNRWLYRVTHSPAGWSAKFHLSADGHPHFSHEVEQKWGCYSKRCKYPAASDNIQVSVTAETVHYFPRLQVNGLMVIDAHRIAPREFAMQWLEQGRGLSEKIIDGYYIRGRHVVATSLDAARKKVTQLRHRAARAEREKRVDRRFRALKDEEFYKLAKRAWVTREDSIQVGNCSSATDQFKKFAAAHVNATGEFALRGDVLLALRDDSYTRRAVTHAMHRIAH